VITVAREGPISPMRAKKTMNARAVQTSANASTESPTSALIELGTCVAA
jgi:hypothetical protein